MVDGEAGPRAEVESQVHNKRCASTSSDMAPASLETGADILTMWYGRLQACQPLLEQMLWQEPRPGKPATGDSENGRDCWHKAPSLLDLPRTSSVSCFSLAKS